MTKEKTGNGLKKEIQSATYSLVCLIVVLLFGLVLSGELSGYVRDGMLLAIECVIPSSFPFMIISDLYLFMGRPENIFFLRKFFAKTLGLPISGLSAFLCGNIGGFPIGAKMVADIYSSGNISKKDAERLLPLCNNPSCAFVVGGVGLGIYNDLKIGIMLLASIWISTLICGVVTNENKSENHFCNYKAEQTYNFVSSVKSAGLSSVSIISFISVFAVINGIIKKRVKYAPLSYFISAFLEVTNAVKSFSHISSISPDLALFLSAFSLGFGGISVAMQSTVFTSIHGLKMNKYYLIKLFEGIISSIVFSIMYLAVKRTAAL